MITIVGAGLSGLSAAHHLKKEYTLLERDSKVGGLCQSINIDGYVFDYAPHILFTRNPYTKELFNNLLGDNLHTQTRRAYIYMMDTYVKYPFEANLYPLPSYIKEECINGVLEKQENKPRNFYEWIQNTMGSGIAKHYMIPYNEKIWKYPLTKMNIEWIKGRVPSPSVEEMRKGAEAPQPIDYGPNAEFWYPKHGGIGALADNLAENLNIKLGVEATWFNPSEAGVETLYVEDFEEKTMQSEKVLSSLPLPEIINMMDDVPDEVQTAADNLVYNSLVCVMVGVKRSRITDKHWLYFPEPELVFNRISFPMNFSPYTTPEECSSILVEVTYRDNIMDLEDTKRRVLKDLVETNLISENDEIQVCEAIDFQYAYVIYDLNHRKNVKVINEYLVAHNIVPIGRFGEWEYYNMDKAILSGKQAAEALNQ
jgi:UDP-galactopyranose mutase